MAESVLKLKKQAVELGADKEWAVKAGRSELEEFIANSGKAKKTTKKSSTKSEKKKPAAKKQKAAKKKAEPKAEAKKSGKKNSKKAPAEKSAKTGKAKRPEKSEDKDAGRVLISGIDWSVESDDWKPREKSPVQRLFKALKKHKGNVNKAYETLAPDIWDFVGKTKRDGSKRTKAEAEAILRYRLNRTKFEFATRTGQHIKGGNRVKYGTGAHATKTKKAARKEKAAAKKSEPKKGKKKSGKK